MSQGVIYYNRGWKCIVRLIVCIQSLRKHYGGNITLFQDGDGDTDLLKDLQKQFGVDVIYDQNPDSATLVRKIEVSQKSPYDYTTLIDADMVVVGKIDETFDAAKKYEFVATHFADWLSSGGTIRGRILRFKEAKPDWMEPAINYGPAINTGVYSFPKETPFFNEWLPLAKIGESMHTWIPDEVACQILLPRYKSHVLPAKFNVSVKFDPGTEDKRILHYHGKKHVIKEKLCKIWIDAFQQACAENICNIRKFTDSSYGDRRLNKFFNCKYGWEKEVKQIKSILSSNKSQSIEKNENEVTIVTATDPKYVGHLKLTYPNWVKYKNITKYPMILYVNGFKNGCNDSQLDFIRNHPNIKIIEWDFKNTNSQRERMLSAFVFGAARDVTTPYWIKLDADAFFTDHSELFTKEMKDYDIYGHKWGYTKPFHWIKELDEWASDKDLFKKTKSLFDEKNVEGRRYNHKRVASYVQCHKSDFVKLAANIAGDKMPVPSQDTYLWYVAERSGSKWHRHNFKRFSGISNASDVEKLKRCLDDVNNTAK